MTHRTDHLDERTRADLDDLVALRGLGAGRAGRLVAALVGEGHDRAFLVAANALAVLAAAAPTTDALVAAVLDPALARPAGLAARLKAAAADDGALRIEDDRVVLQAGGARFDLAWSQVADAAALVHFLLVADGLVAFAEVRAAIEDFIAGPPAADGAVRDLARALGRIAYRYRTEHFPERDLFRRNQPLVAFLAERMREGRGLITDALVLEAWLAEVARGERTLFETTARRCLAVETALADRRLRGRRAGDVAVDLVADRFDAAEGAGLGTGEGVLTPLDRVEALPEVPKVLMGPERQLLAGLFGLHPFERDRTLTVLRALVFGALQERLVKRAAAGAGGPGDRAPAGGYAARIDDARALHEHLVNVAVLVVEAGKALAGTAPEDNDDDDDDDAPDADDGADRPAPAADRPLPRARRIRRDGFALPAAEIAAAFSGSRVALATLIDEIRRFLSMSSPLASRFEADAAVFESAFRGLYAMEGADR